MSTKKALPPPINKGIIWKMKTADKEIPSSSNFNTILLYTR